MYTITGGGGVVAKTSAERGTVWAVSLRHAASETVRPALLIGGRGGSAVDVAVEASAA